MLRDSSGTLDGLDYGSFEFVTRCSNAVTVITRVSGCTVEKSDRDGISGYSLAPGDGWDAAASLA